ncbi:substrate-binding domain-containing protein [Bradyrhizobium sp. CB1650]|uniref:substrate-binding domain-containing protein n=1 Tax=Bradyrhizobium sp. CB1650 TaxID=3039153 RepID=UPI002435EDC9|nr:substrate-binding domain-containing protein [Bradyrhizobium sp. CB1650]WGD50255.1 substrate-binding domain-containing protein [Bradyrhizobium sp. CB1650]
MRKAALATALAIALLLPLTAQAAERVQPDSIFPPWQHGENNDATQRGLAFTVPEVDDLADFHGDVSDPKLVLYVGGNYFFAMAPLIAAFEREHPEFKGRIYWETLPPGLLEKQIEAGGTVTSGNMTWTAKPDAYLAGLKKVQSLVDRGLLTGPAVPYVTNSLTIMVPAHNPGHVKNLSDLGRPDLHVAMPNPEFEGIARQIEGSLKKVGGEALATAVYKTKVADRSTILTQIHHRQTPLFLMKGRAQAGVTWQSEATFQEQIGNPVTHVDIPPAQNAMAIYAGAEVRSAPHPEAARLWLSFIRSPTALSIFERYGFKPFTKAAG